MAGCIIQRGREWSAFFLEVVHVDDCSRNRTVTFAGQWPMGIQIGVAVNFEATTAPG